MESYKLARANLSETDCSGRTALHVILRQNLRGELTPEIPNSGERCLEMNQFCVNTVLFPALLCSAVLAGDTQKIDTLISWPIKVIAVLFFFSGNNDAIREQTSRSQM
ncbi:hypothetical protein J437_LFUL019666 [Ladona fulva]|nr:hypothetical protein J437_LFUL019666 [Ladona fulva]